MFRFFRKKKSPDEADQPDHADQADQPVEPNLADQPDVPEATPLDEQAQALPAAYAEDTEPLPDQSTLGSESPESESPDPAPTPSPNSWVGRLKQGLSRTGRQIGGLFAGNTIDESLYEDLESALIMADAGVQASESLIQSLRKQVRQQQLNEPQAVRRALVEVLAAHLRPLEKPFDVGAEKPLVVMIAGVNGAGKTTSIGKLAYALRAQGASVLLAAGDTFRAAAREQLIEWGERNGVAVIAQDGGDPAAVAFDAVAAGRARQIDVVMVDTAGRLPTQLNLMAELKKIKRVIAKAQTDAPQEVLLVVDGNTGQNALTQIKAFDEALGLTGLIVTKLDGTAKGGVLAALASGAQGCRAVPVYWVGVGEQLEDLQPFVAHEFAQALIQ